MILISGFVDSLGLNEESTGADVVIQKSANEVSHLVEGGGAVVEERKLWKKPAGVGRGCAGEEEDGLAGGERRTGSCWSRR